MPAGIYYWNLTAIDGSFKFSYSSSTVASVYTPTGIVNDVTSAEIKISPNPFINNLTVYNTKKNGEIWITDITGKNAWAQKNDSGKTQITFDKSVPEGLCFLYIIVRLK